MRHLAGLFVGFALQPLAAGAAFASAGMVCDALDHSGATVEMNLPRSAGAAPNWVRVSAHDKLYSSLATDEGAVVIGTRQFFEDSDSFFIDLSDETWSDATIRIRLLKAEEGDALPVYFGYVQVAGEGITPISCIEDE